MKKLSLATLLAVIALAFCSAAYAGPVYAVSNQLGYQGTVWNITEGTVPWTTSTPRDATLYTVVNAPQIYSNYNMLASNWSEHAVSNQNNSFFQLAEAGNASVTSATGAWSSDLMTFEMTVTGADAPYPWSRFWQPDNSGVAWGVTFTNYSYTITATFSTAAVLDSYGFYVNTNPDTIVGSFTGQFVVTYDVNKNPITTGDTYGFDIGLSKASLAPLDATSGWDGSAVTAYSEFGATAVPDAGSTLALMSGALLGLGALRRRFRA